MRWQYVVAFATFKKKDDIKKVDIKNKNVFKNDDDHNNKDNIRNEDYPKNDDGLKKEDLGKPSKKKRTNLGFLLNLRGGVGRASEGPTPLTGFKRIA